MIRKLLVTFFLVGISGLLVYGFVQSAGGGTDAFRAEKNSSDEPTRFLLEVFASIKKNYWEAVDDVKLKELFSLATVRVASTSPLASSSTPLQFEQFLRSALATKPRAEQTLATLQIGELVLNNLQPFGRSHIFSTAQEKDLRDTVNNINEAKDLYASLGVPKDASPEDIATKYEEQISTLEKEGTPEATEKIKELSYIKEVLTDAKKKTRYDEKKIEPTIFLKTLSPSMAYLNLTKFSPTTLTEFVDVVAKLPTSPAPRNLIIDMRGNIGGSSDIVPYLSGFFIGHNLYAFDFFTQGTYTPFKTPTGKLPGLLGLKKIIILIDGATQSSAELFTSVLKKYNKATAIGTRSKGWGTIENTFPLTANLEGKSYTLFLVHSITLREDGQPIEGRGVDPDIDIGDKNWTKTATDLFEDSALVRLLEQTFKNRP